jgi:hypothetical protein
MNQSPFLAWMKHAKKPATLVNTLSVRLDDPTLGRLVAGAKSQRRLLSDYVRLLLLERAEREHAGV